MKSKLILFPLLSLLLIGCTNTPNKADALGETTTPNLITWLDKFDTNYIRDTQMNFTSDAYKTVSTKNKFKFTQNRRTLWVDNGLYMTSLTEEVNAGYYSVIENEKPQLYRYTLPNDNPSTHINDTVVPEGFNSVKQTGYEVNMNDFFINMHKFHNNQEWANKFTYDDKGGFISSDPEILDDFMAFTASCYTNPSFPVEGETAPIDETSQLTSENQDSIIVEEPFLEFKQARITKDENGEMLRFELYVMESCFDKVASEIGLFSVAQVYNADKTEIPVLNAYISANHI